MKGSLSQVLLAICITCVGLACRKPQAIMPSKPVPPGTVLLMFTRKVEGPVELTVDGTRIPVEKVSRKKCSRLEVTGLAQGKHQFILLSPLEAFGPDQVDVDLGPQNGEYRVLFSQQFRSVLYGKPEPAPAASGIPGVKARLQP